MVAELVFYDDDTEADVKLKSAMLDIYNARLTQRERRKNLSIKMQLLGAQCVPAANRRVLNGDRGAAVVSKKEGSGAGTKQGCKGSVSHRAVYLTCPLLRVAHGLAMAEPSFVEVRGRDRAFEVFRRSIRAFAKYWDPVEHRDLLIEYLRKIYIERRVQQIQSYRKYGVQTREQCDIFRDAMARRRSKTKPAKRMNQYEFGPIPSMRKTSADAAAGELPGVSELSTAEAMLCRSERLFPSQYQALKLRLTLDPDGAVPTDLSPAKVKAVRHFLKVNGLIGNAG